LQIQILRTIIAIYIYKHKRKNIIVIEETNQLSSRLLVSEISDLMFLIAYIIQAIAQGPYNIIIKVCT